MENTIDLLFTLKEVALFANIPDHILAEVASIIDIQEVPASERFIHQGLEGDGLYVVKSGVVRVHTDRADICTLRENDIVGELSVLAPIKRSAHVTAETDCILYHIHRIYFLQLMNDIPEIVPPILQVLTQKITKSNESFIDIRG